MNILENFGIKIQHLDPQRTEITMAVTDRTKQPYGLLHGGMNSVLAETAASLAANAYLPEEKVAVGVNIETHHLKAVTDGELSAQATPLHLGQRLMVYQVAIHLVDNPELTSMSTVTLTAQPAPK
ncbi:MAG: PaaI family thioesterase [Lactobacillus sp.]|jgi:uncharacterized protein (TIGR00369 family)|nr:PaaI family thioesterase [Lactobacillus sp.]